MTAEINAAEYLRELGPSQLGASDAEQCRIIADYIETLIAEVQRLREVERWARQVCPIANQRYIVVQRLDAALASTRRSPAETGD